MLRDELKEMKEVKAKLSAPEAEEDADKSSDSLKDLKSRVKTLEEQLRVMDDNFRRAKIKK